MTSKVIVTKSKLNAIGDAIREKTGKTSPYTLDEMPVKIRAFSGSGSGFGAAVTITTRTPEFYGQKVFLTNGIDTMTQTFSDQGIAVFINVEWEGELTVYVIYEGTKYVSTIVVQSRYNTELQYDSLMPWTAATDEQIAKTLQAYYNGVLSLEDIQSVWHVGDKRTIHLSSIGGSLINMNNTSTCPEQDVEMVILDFEHDDLETPINNRTKALITIQQKDCLMDTECAAGTRFGEENTCGGSMFTGFYPEGDMTTTHRFAWLNNNYYNSIPENFRNFIKDVKHIYYNKNYDEGKHIQTSKIFYPSSREMMGNHSYSNNIEGTQYEYYKTASNRIKMPKWREDTAGACYFTRTWCGDDKYIAIWGSEAIREGAHKQFGNTAAGGNHAPAMCL